MNDSQKAAILSESRNAETLKRMGEESNVK